MSVFSWKLDNYGHVGDHVHGRVTIVYWQDREEFEAGLDKQLAEIRDAVLADWPRPADQS